jgi:hypothetical protein
MYHHPDSGRNPVSTSPPTASKLHNLETKFVVCISSNSGDDFFFVVGGESVCRIGFNRLVENGF